MIDWKIVEMSIPLLLEGTWVTLYVSFFAGIIGTFAGIVIGLLSLSNIKPIEWVIRIYVDFVRGTPLLIQIFLVFFALPVVGITMNEIWAGITALAFNLAGYAAEIVRGGVGAVEKGQTEAAKSVGMTRGKILVYILLPQAARQMVPPFTNEMITMIKSSSLLSVISVYELTRSGQAIISVHFVPFEIYGLLALYYWVMITTLSWLTRRLEARLPVW
ncbi:MAG: amino acid ABC transporter permease [Gammaproteobacteria bacterium]|nr:amino acid ABC transporter permease [Gammaproteobacteria bacterium]